MTLPIILFLVRYAVDFFWVCLQCWIVLNPNLLPAFTLKLLFGKLLSAFTLKFLFLCCLWVSSNHFQFQLTWLTIQILVGSFMFNLSLWEWRCSLFVEISCLRIGFFLFWAEKCIGWICDVKKFTFTTWSWRVSCLVLFSFLQICTWWLACVLHRLATCSKLKSFINYQIGTLELIDTIDLWYIWLISWNNWFLLHIYVHILCMQYRTQTKIGRKNALTKKLVHH